MEYYDLKSKTMSPGVETKGLSFLYDNFFGRVLLRIMISKPITRAYATYMKSPLSKLKIKKFIEKNNIDMDEYIETDYKCFNDFFKRNIKSSRRVVEEGNVAVCDAKLSVYKIDKDLKLQIKNSIYTVEELIREKDCSRYEGGYALVYRLAVDDYHHYIYPCEGMVVSRKKIKGKLHTVQPIAQKRYKVFSENSREVFILDTKEYGEMAYIEVGAMLVGKIVNERATRFFKGQEKGHFEFGGSTIVLLVGKNEMKINKKILENTKMGVETIVKMGQNIE